jgi:hypothetical protein
LELAAIKRWAIPLAPVVINGGIFRASGAERQVPNPIIVNGSFTLGRLTHLNGGVTLNANATITQTTSMQPANNPSNIGAITGNFRVSFDQGPQGIGTGCTGDQRTEYQWRRHKHSLGSRQCEREWRPGKC